MTVQELLKEIESKPDYRVYVYDPTAENYVELTGVLVDQKDKRVYMQTPS